jgi:DNA polymerase (family 10)
MHNVEIAALLDEVADLLEIRGSNPFRIRAYRNAERTVESQTEPLERMLAAGRDLTELPAIGAEMARHVAEISETGTLELRDRMIAEVPRGLIDLMRLPNVGPKRARTLWQALGVDSVDALEAAARDGRVSGVAGFGEKSQAKILAGIADFRRQVSRMRLADVERVVEPLAEWLRGAPELGRLEIAGSYRRRRETVGDVDLLATAAGDPGAVARRFTAYPQAAEVKMSGDTRSSIALRSGLQIDLRVVPEASWGAALVYFTGSKEHNIRLRQRGVERGLRISEYGVFRVEGEGEPFAGTRIAGAEEAEVYAAVSCAWVPPELREDRGELEAAAAGRLPRLLELGDLRGDLQMHSTWSDGKASIEEMLEACAARGYQYFALTDHSKALAMTGGLDAARLAEQWREIDEIVARHPEIRLLKSLEVDILADGSLDLEDEMLARLDLVVVSVHSRFGLPAAEQTERILAAVRHPAVDVLAHPTGRLIGRREPFDFDLDAVLRACAEHRVAVELNAQPDRLDLKDTHLMRAKELGVKVVVSTDAHSPAGLDAMRWGVEQARRAWLGPADVLNTLPLPDFLAAIGHPEGKGVIFDEE